MDKESKLLKPCPFCGGEAKLTTGFNRFENYVICSGCGKMIGLYTKKEEAIEAWNTRKPIDAIADAVEVVRCEDCTLHNKCSTEDVFKFAGINNPFCCAGKKVQDD